MEITTGIIVAVYMLGMIFIGIFSSKKVHSLNDYVVAGKTVPFWTNVHSMSGTIIGAGATMGTAGLCYAFGISGVWILIGGASGMALGGLVFAKKLWQSGAITIPEVMKKNYTKPVRDTVTIVTLFGAIAVTAAQMLALGLIAQVILKIDLVYAMAIAGVVMIVYTVLGGLFAVATTDVLNMTLCAIGIMVILPLIGLLKVGGMSGIREALEPRYFHPFGMGVIAIIGILSWIIPGSMREMGVMNRMFAAKNAKEAKSATVTAALAVYLPYAICVMTIGLVGAALYPGIKGDAIIPTMIVDLVHPVVAGLLLASLLAAVMSCADSILLATGAIIANDIFKRINPNLSEKTLVAVSRYSVLVLGVLSFFLALTAKGLISLMQNISAPGVVILPILVVTFFWKRATSAGVLSAILASIVASTVWWSLGKPFGIHHVVVALVVSTLVLIIVCLATSKKIAKS